MLRPRAFTTRRGGVNRSDIAQRKRPAVRGVEVGSMWMLQGTAVATTGRLPPRTARAEATICRAVLPRQPKWRERSSQAASSA